MIFKQEKILVTVSFILCFLNSCTSGSVNNDVDSAIINDEESATENELDNNEADSEETAEMPDDLECGEYCIGSDCKDFGLCEEKEYCKDNKCLKACIDMECGWDFVLCGVCDYGDSFFCGENNNCSKWECNGFCWDSPYTNPEEIENRFTESGEGEIIVTDKYTNLKWTKKSTFTSCDSIIYGGINGWHIPSIEELETLLKYYKTNPVFSDFPEIEEGVFISASYIEVPEDWDYYGINTITGELVLLSSIEDQTPKFTKCVKINYKSDAEQRFQELLIGEEYIDFDLRTGLKWTRRLEQNDSIESSVKFCKDLIYGGFDDWTLPNIYQLKTLMYTGRKGQYRSYSESAAKEIMVDFDSDEIRNEWNYSKWTICVRQN